MAQQSPLQKFEHMSEVLNDGVSEGGIMGEKGCRADEINVLVQRQIEGRRESSEDTKPVDGEVVSDSY